MHSVIVRKLLVLVARGSRVLLRVLLAVTVAVAVIAVAVRMVIGDVIEVVVRGAAAVVAVVGLRARVARTHDA